MNCNQKSNGNVLFLVLLGVILFAALSYAVTQGMNNMDGGISNERNDLLANDILQYAKQLEQGVRNVTMKNGHSENDISFAHDDLVADYGTYGTTPTAEIFNPLGGNVAYRSFPKASDYDWYFTGQNHVQDLGAFNEPLQAACDSGGTDCNDLLAILRQIPLSLCLALNKKLGIEEVSAGSPPADLGSFNLNTYYDGSFPAQASIGDDPTRYLWGKRAACFEQGNAAGNYHFYYALLVR